MPILKFNLNMKKKLVFTWNFIDIYQNNNI